MDNVACAIMQRKQITFDRSYYVPNSPTNAVADTMQKAVDDLQQWLHYGWAHARTLRWAHSCHIADNTDAVQFSNHTLQASDTVIGSIRQYPCKCWAMINQHDSSMSDLCHGVINIVVSAEEGSSLHRVRIAFSHQNM